ncbi:MAG: hypothetical protein E2O96_06415, partial [Acidobacteria bacterium]
MDTPHTCRCRDHRPGCGCSGTRGSRRVARWVRDCRVLDPHHHLDRHHDWGPGVSALSGVLGSDGRHRFVLSGRSHHSGGNIPWSSPGRRAWPLCYLIGDEVEVITVDADADLTDATLIAGVLEDLEPAPGSESAFASIDSAHLDSAGFEGKRGQTLKVPHDGAAALLLVGLGNEISFETVRAASGNAIRKAKTERVVTLLAHVGIDGATRAVVEGSALGGYQFRTYKT